MTPLAVFVPGRLEVFGKHTDYAGGRSLVAAVPRGITATVERGRREEILIEDAVSGETAIFSAAGEGPADGWRVYPHAVIRRLAANFGGCDLSSRIRFASDLPQAAGISSSSALVIAMAESLIACGGIESTPAWRTAIRSLEERAGYFGCIENGADFGGLAGSAGVGTHGGSEDHAAIVLSRPRELRLFAYSPIRCLGTIPMPAGWTFVIASSGADARKAGAARSDYNRLAHEIQALTDVWRESHAGDRRSLGELSRQGELRGWRVPAALRPRLDHFLAEDARVVEAADAFARGDVSSVAELADASQSDADRLLANQIDEARALVSQARALGAVAASAFGAGWGGSVWALLPEADADAFLVEWLREYGQRFPHRAAQGFVSPPSSGVRRL